MPNTPHPDAEKERDRKVAERWKQKQRKRKQMFNHSAINALRKLLEELPSGPCYCSSRVGMMLEELQNDTSDQ